MAWLTVLGLTWKGGPFRHPFDIVDVPQRGGVFKLHGQRPDGSWEVFFVSQSANLYLALLACLETGVGADVAQPAIPPTVRERVASGAISFSYAEVSDETERAGCVRSLCQYYRPACNDLEHLPPVQGVACNPY